MTALLCTTALASLGVSAGAVAPVAWPGEQPSVN
jgi:hypothetical protein